LGEKALSAIPGQNFFDARLNLPNSQIYSKKDYRNCTGSNNFEYTYKVQYQKGTGNSVTLKWDLADGLKMKIQDAITGYVIDTMFNSGIDSLMIANPDSINQLELTVTNFLVTPVELVSFTGNVKNNDAIELIWKTATEVNNKGFEIQRKINSKWEKVAFIEGSGTSTTPKEYKYVDDFKYKSYKATISYRLKQIDFDGTSEYSNKVDVKVDFSPKDYVLYQNYPNPFNPTTTIKYTLPKESNVDIMIYNALGQRIEEFNEGVKVSGDHNVVWQANNMASGVYFCTITAKSTDGKNSFSKTQKMMLLK
jgi:Secretion system C-terminal sorting domain